MNLVDRLIEKAKKIKLTYGDSVFIISNESGEWTVDGQAFPDFEAAQAYVEGLLPDDEPDSVVIINDLGPSDENFKGTDTEAWLWEIREENEERRRQEQEKERLNRPPEKDRRLI